MNRLIYHTRFQIETLHLNDADEETKIRQFPSCGRVERRTKDGGLTGASNTEAVPTQGPGGGGGNGII